MPLRTIRIRSRYGNLVLASLGVLYAAAAAVLLARFLFEAWDASFGKDELLLVVMLVAAIGAGAWFVNCALRARRTSSAAVA